MFNICVCVQSTNIISNNLVMKTRIMWDNWVVLYLFSWHLNHLLLCQTSSSRAEATNMNKKIPGVKEILDPCEWDRYFQGRSHELHGDRRCWDDAQWYFIESKGCQTSGSAKHMKDPGHRTGWSSLIFSFHSFLPLCLISFSFLHPATLQLMGPHSGLSHYSVWGYTIIEMLQPKQEAWEAPTGTSERWWKGRASRGQAEDSGCNLGHLS